MKKLIFTTLIALWATFANAQWKQINGTESENVNCLTVNGSNIFAGTSNISSGGVLLSRDTGISWAAVNNGLTSMSVNALATSGKNVFAGTSNGIFMSGNNGSNWTSIFPTFIITSLATIDSKIFAGTDFEGLYLSSNNGGNWKRIFGDLGTVIYNLAVNGNNICMAAGEGVFMSNDQGKNWTLVSADLTGTSSTFTRTMAINGSNIFVGTNSGLYTVNNVGGNWMISDTTFKGVYVFSIEIFDTNIFAATGNGVFLSTNNGKSWININEGFPWAPFHIITSFAINGGYVFACTNGGGVWKRVLKELPVSLTKINTFKSEVDIYPNPSSGKFMISSLSKIDGVCVYNTLGELVLNESYFDQTTKIEIDLSTFGKGIYFITINGENGIANKKVIFE